MTYSLALDVLVMKSLHLDPGTGIGAQQYISQRRPCTHYPTVTSAKNQNRTFESHKLSDPVAISANSSPLPASRAGSDNGNMVQMSSSQFTRRCSLLQIRHVHCNYHVELLFHFEHRWYDPDYGERFY